MFIPYLLELFPILFLSVFTQIISYPIPICIYSNYFLSVFTRIISYPITTQKFTEIIKAALELKLWIKFGIQPCYISKLLIIVILNIISTLYLKIDRTTISNKPL
jgi:hypothetical protein